MAARLADRVLLTSDNPRGEDPLAIIDAVRAGMAAHRRRCTVEPDRARGHRPGRRRGRPGDVVVIAGKGHEAVQVVGDRVARRSTTATWPATRSGARRDGRRVVALLLAAGLAVRRRRSSAPSSSSTG